jgi:hypothetical protein
MLCDGCLVQTEMSGPSGDHLDMLYDMKSIRKELLRWIVFLLRFDGDKSTSVLNELRPKLEILFSVVVSNTGHFNKNVAGDQVHWCNFLLWIWSPEAKLGNFYWNNLYNLQVITFEERICSKCQLIFLNLFYQWVNLISNNSSAVFAIGRVNLARKERQGGRRFWNERFFFFYVSYSN